MYIYVYIWYSHIKTAVQEVHAGRKEGQEDRATAGRGGGRGARQQGRVQGKRHIQALKHFISFFISYFDTIWGNGLLCMIKI